MIDYTQETVALDVPGIPEDTLYIAERLERMAALLADIRNATIRAEGPNPQLLDILTFNGCTAGELVGRFASSTRLRVETVIPVVSLTTTMMSLIVGVERKFTVRVNTGASTIPFPLPIVIPEGVDVSAEIETAQAAGGRAGFYVIAYPETA